ncbi:MAG: mevalonate kinase, partial [Wenzhouxiangellaceae bacterium]
GRLSAPQLGLELNCRNLDRAANALVDDAGGQALGLTGRWIPRLLSAHGVNPARLAELDLEIDSSELYAPPAVSVTGATGATSSHAIKLGLGSSAAVSVALARVLSAVFEFGSEWSNPEAWLQDLLPIYRDALGTHASGADLAASLFGGAIVYRDGPGGVTVTPAAWPGGLQWCPVWTGQPAQTTDFVRRFSDWRASSAESGQWMAQLSSIARRACRMNAGEGELLSALGDYAKVLAAMAAAAGLEIVTPAHARLARLAEECGVVYKSCGAGGGDLGIAVADNAAGLQAFLGRIEEKHGVALESATSDGVKLEVPAQGDRLPGNRRVDQ